MCLLPHLRPRSRSLSQTVDAWWLTVGRHCSGYDSISISWLRLSLIPAKDMQMPRQQAIGENVSYLAAAAQCNRYACSRRSITLELPIRVCHKYFVKILSGCPLSAPNVRRQFKKWLGHLSTSPPASQLSFATAARAGSWNFGSIRASFDTPASLSTP